MSSAHTQQQNGHIAGSWSALPEDTPSEQPAGVEPVSNGEETDQRELPNDSHVSPLPGIRGSLEELFSEELSLTLLLRDCYIGILLTRTQETEHSDLPSLVVHLPPTAGVEEGSTPSPTDSQPSERLLVPRVATPRPGPLGENINIPGLPPRFPSPTSVRRSTPPGVHRGPASSSSLSEYDPSSEAVAPLSPSANLALAMLRRGPPPGAMDPMQIPHDPAAGGGVVVTPAEAARYRASAARHAAMVFKRMTDADSEVHANFLDREFTRIFGREYGDAYVRLIADPPESAASNMSDDGEDDID